MHAGVEGWGAGDRGHEGKQEKHDCVVTSVGKYVLQCTSCMCVRECMHVCVCVCVCV